MKIPKRVPACVYRNERPAEGGFTRSELCAIVLLLTLAVIVTLPVLANGRARADRIECANNLRQLGVAFLVWGADHGDAPPFDIPMNQGGTRQHPLSANVWLHFSWLSNQLSGPKLVFCPTDLGKPAGDFTGNPESGYVHPNFANRATSYFLAHASVATPAAVLAGDRNIRTGSPLASCSRFNGALASSPNPFIGNLAWGDSLHRNEGNLLLMDGRVAQTDQAGLRKIVTDSQATDSSGLHYVTPR